MNMQTIRANEYRQAFRVDHWDIERLVAVLGGDQRISRIVVEFGDGSSATLEHAGELSELPNSASRVIRRIWFESRPPAFAVGEQDLPQLTIVELRDQGPYGVSFHVSGDERVVRETAMELQGWAESVSPWYGRLAFTGRMTLFALTVLMICATALAGLSGAILVGGMGTSEFSSATGSGSVALISAAVGLVALLATIGLLCARRDRLFPRAQFHFGDGAHRHARENRRRGWLIGATGAAAIATVVATVLAGALR
jgi:hypothetical protein